MITENQIHPLKQDIPKKENNSDIVSGINLRLSLNVLDGTIRNSLFEELKQHFNIIEPENNQINGDHVDFYLLDIKLYNKNKDHLLELKELYAGEVYPVLILTHEDTNLDDYPDLWDLADDIIEYPVKTEFILSRINLLLRYRKMAKSLKISQNKLKKKENQLRKENEFMDFAADHIQGILYIINEDLNFEYWNQNLTHDFGYTDEEIALLNPYDLFLPDYRELLSNKLKEVIINGSADFNAKVCTKSGEIKDHFITGTLLNKNGKKWIVGSSIDITDKVRAEYECLQQKYLMESIINQGNAIIYVKDHEGNFKTVNQNFLNLFEITDNIDSGKNNFDILSHPLSKIISQNDDQVVAKNELIDFDEVVNIGGTNRYFNTIKYPLKDVPGFENHMCGIITEITEKKTLITNLEYLYNAKNCHLQINKLLEESECVKEILKETPDHLLRGFRNPEITHVMISYGEDVYFSSGFKKGVTFFESNVRFVNDIPLKITAVISKKLLESTNVTFTDDELGVINSICGSLCTRIGWLENLYKLKESEQRWENLVQNDPDLVMIVQNDTIKFMNEAGAIMYKSVPEKIIGQNLFELVKITESELAKKRLQEVKSGVKSEPYIHKIQHPITKEIKFLKIQSIPVEYNGSKAIQIVGTDLTELVKSEYELRNSLQEKEVLLQEIHHRVKNNLAVVSGMLELKIFSEDNKLVKETLTSSVTRIKSIALVHEKLYKQQSLAHVDFREYTQDLIANILNTYNSNEKIQISLNSESIVLNVNQAVPCALMLSELITNALKYGVISSEEGIVNISLKKKNDRVFVCVQDNGPGFSNDFLNENRSMGVTILKTLSDQLSANLYADNNNGACICFDFENKNMKGSSSNFLN